MDFMFPKTSAPDEIRVLCAARFAAAAIAFRSAVKAAAASYLVEPAFLGVPADYCYDLLGDDAEVGCALDGARARFPADRFDLRHSFSWREAGLYHLIDPIPRR